MERIKTARGVYLDLDKSPYYLIYQDRSYKFSSNKKLDMFIKRSSQRLDYIDKLVNKIYRLSDTNIKDYSLYDLIKKVYDKVYTEMIYK